VTIISHHIIIRNR